MPGRPFRHRLAAADGSFLFFFEQVHHFRVDRYLPDAPPNFRPLSKLKQPIFEEFALPEVAFFQHSVFLPTLNFSGGRGEL
jgi:hypothetical protein